MIDNVPNAVDADGASLLRHAAFDGGGSVECVRVLLEAKADVENAGKDRGGSSAQNTPLLISAVTGMADVVEVLLEYGARTDGGPRSNETFGQPSLDKVPLIVVSGLICKMFSDEPSHNQMRTRYERIFRLLLGKADAELKLICLLRVASLNCAGAVKIIGWLRADGVDPDGIARGREDRHGTCEVHYPAIWAACSSKAPLCLQALLAAGANPSLSMLDVPSKTPMSIATEHEDKECISLLNGALRRGKGLVGCHVLVEGFRRAKPAINGRQGMVLGFEDDTGLCRVQVEFGKGYWSSEGSALCDQAAEGFYLSTQKRTPKPEPCPNGVACEKAGTTTELMELTDGWFKFANATAAVYECPYEANCQTPDLNASGAVGQSLCADGSGGALCSVCDRDFYLHVPSGGKGRCVACSKGSLRSELEAIEVAGLPWAERPGAVRRSSTSRTRPRTPQRRRSTPGAV